MAEIKDDNTEQVKSKMEKAVERGLVSIGMAAETAAANNCPVDTGRLRASITYATSVVNIPKNYEWDDKKHDGKNAGKDVTQANGQVPAHTVVIGTNVEYAPYVEYGANKREPVHFLSRAAQEHTEEYRELLIESIKKA